MTPPRSVIPGKVWFLTARAVNRMFKFVPRREVVRLFQYLFAVAAQEYGMRIHEALCMSNHFHVLLTDVEGQLPAFMHHFNTLFARSLNAMRGESGSVFEKGYNRVEVTTDEKALEHAVYILANPCEAHLVRRSKQWPGFSTLRMNYGEPVVIKRPKMGLWKRVAEELEQAREQRMDPKREAHRGKPSTMPEAVTLTLERPAIRPELSDAELRAEVFRRLDVCEFACIVERDGRGAEVLGVKKVLAQPWYAFPRRPKKMFGTEPSVSGKSKWARMEAEQRRKEFQQAHAEARRSFLAGILDVLWPYGTWLMRVRFGLPCGMAPP